MTDFLFLKWTKAMSWYWTCIMKASDGIALPQKSFNYFQLWQTIVSARLCCTSIKANKVAGHDWGSLLVSLSTPLQRVMGITGLRSKESICSTQILKYRPIQTFSYLFVFTIHPSTSTRLHWCIPSNLLAVLSPSATVGIFTIWTVKHDFWWVYTTN